MIEFLTKTTTILVFIASLGLFIEFALSRSARMRLHNRLEDCYLRLSYTRIPKIILYPILLILLRITESEKPLTAIILSVIAALYILLITIASIAPLVEPYAAYILNNESLTVIFIMLAFLLYRIRGTHRFLYGILEFVVGVTAVWVALHTENFGETGMILQYPRELLLSKAITVLSGTYVIIRGLDNMSQKLPERMQRAWGVFFPSARV